MEVLEANSAWLSNYEVFAHLGAQRAERDRIAAQMGRAVRAAENVLTVEFETLEYLGGRAGVAENSPEKIAVLMAYLKTLSLTKAEKLQLVNMLPRTPVEFYLIVEECEERFTPDAIEQVLSRLAEIAGSLENAASALDNGVAAPLLAHPNANANAKLEK